MNCRKSKLDIPLNLFAPSDCTHGLGKLIDIEKSQIDYNQTIDFDNEPSVR